MRENNEKRIISKIEKRYARMMLSNKINEDRARVRKENYYLF